MTALPAQAEWSKVYNIEFAMGDGDNRNSARQAGLEQLKLKASQEAGTYIQSTTTLENGDSLSQNIHMIGASMVKLTEEHDALTLQNGHAILQIGARATIDEAELARRVKAMQKDKEKAHQMEVLKAENDDLRRGLSVIRDSLNGPGANSGKLLTQQDKTIQKLIDNQQSVGQVFESGTLLTMATENISELEKAKNNINENLFAPLLDTPVKAEILTVRKEGAKYVAMVNVSWKIDTARFIKVLSPYLNVRAGTNDNRDGLSMTEYRNRHNQGPHYLSEQIYDYIGQKGVNLKLKVGTKEYMIPVLYGDNNRQIGECRAENNNFTKKEASTICLVSQSANSHKIHAFGNDQTNPVRIELTQEQAAGASRIEATFVEL